MTGWKGVFAAGAALVLGSAGAGAQTARSGWYGGLVLGVKVRHVTVWEDFADGGPPDVLRSHEPTVAPGGREVTNTIATGDLGYWGISLTLKHWF